MKSKRSKRSRKSRKAKGAKGAKGAREAEEAGRTGNKRSRKTGITGKIMKKATVQDTVTEYLEQFNRKERISNEENYSAGYGHGIP